MGSVTVVLYVWACDVREQTQKAEPCEDWSLRYIIVRFFDTRALHRITCSWLGDDIKGDTIVFESAGLTCTNGATFEGITCVLSPDELTAVLIGCSTVVLVTRSAGEADANSPTLDLCAPATLWHRRQLDVSSVASRNLCSNCNLARAVDRCCGYHASLPRFFLGRRFH